MSTFPISPEAMQRLWNKPESVWVSPIRRKADLSGGCEKPVLRSFESSPSCGDMLWLLKKNPDFKVPQWEPVYNGAVLVGLHRDAPPKLKHSQLVRIYFDGEFPCRKCARCLARRASHWRYSALVELAMSSRTWMATFTLNPRERFIVDIKRQSRQDPVGWSADKIFADRHRIISRYFTLYFKRLRKNNPELKLRYLLVVEQHKDGWPHYHALLHERGPAITKRELESEWKFGFTNFKLVDTHDKRVVTYVTKYIAKQALARIRASLRYGDGLS